MDVVKIKMVIMNVTENIVHNRDEWRNMINVHNLKQLGLAPSWFYLSYS